MRGDAYLLKCHLERERARIDTIRDFVGGHVWLAARGPCKLCQRASAHLGGGGGPRSHLPAARAQQWLRCGWEEAEMWLEQSVLMRREHSIEAHLQAQGIVSLGPSL